MKSKSYFEKHGLLIGWLLLLMGYYTGLAVGKGYLFGGLSVFVGFAIIWLIWWKVLQ